MKKWIVYCPRCGRSTTGALPPGHPDFTDKVSCVICNIEIDAGKGRFLARPAKPEKPVNLMEVK